MLPLLLKVSAELSIKLQSQVWPDSLNSLCATPLAHPAPATQVSLLITEHVRHAPISEPLRWLFPVPGILLPPDIHMGCSPVAFINILKCHCIHCLRLP